MSSSIFEKIANRKIPGYVVWEDDRYLAFLTIRPWSEGHTLVVPKKNPGDYLFDLGEKEYIDLMIASKTVAKLLKQKLKTDRILISVEGFEVPHVHIHLIPTQNGVGFSKLKEREATPEQLQTVLDKIKSKIILQK